MERGGDPPENNGGDNSNKRCLAVLCITSSPPGNLLHRPDFSLVMLPHNFRFPLIVNSLTIYWKCTSQRPDVTVVIHLFGGQSMLCITCNSFILAVTT